MDFYKLLGISQDATPEEIKKAFREKAKKYHPDINPEGSEMFKKITKAYETLIDKEKRKIYDESLKEKSLKNKIEDIINTIFSYDSPKKGKDISVNIELSLEEAYSGTIKKINYIRIERCNECNATGITDNSVLKQCSFCKGLGKIKTPFMKIICPKCRGRKFIVLNPCVSCKGKGYVEVNKERKIHIPSFSSDKLILKIEKEGDEGFYGGENGNLNINISLKKHHFYTKKGLDLYAKIYLPQEKKHQENKIKIKNLKNETLIVKIPPNIDNRDVLRISGEGFQKKEHKGNIYIEVNFI